MIELTDFHFIRPWLLFTMLPLLWLIYLWWRHTNLTNAWRKVVDEHLIDLLLNKKGLQKKIPIKTSIIASLLFVLAIAGPTIEKVKQPPLEKQENRIILLDLSLSMFAQDVKPSRLDVSLRKIHDILDKNAEGSIGLVVYAGDAFTISPLTTDANTVRSLVSSLSPAIMPVLGSNGLRGVDQAINLFENSNIENGQIIWITDGIEAADMDQIETRISITSHQLDILAIGTAQGAPIPLPNESGYLKDDFGAIIIPKLDLSAITDFAERIRAKATTTSVDDSDIEYLLTNELFNQEQFQISDLEQQGFDVWVDLGPYLTLLLLPFIAYAFRKGLIFIFIAVLIVPPQNAYGFEWKDLWRTKDQQAIEKFNQEDFDKASNLFEDPIWKGVSLYKKGQYEQAKSYFEQVNSAKGHYNRGNALAQLGAIDDAIEAYNKALDLNPDMLDAQKNKELLEQLKNEQQQQNSDGNQNKEQNDQQDSDQENQNQQNNSPQQEGDQQQNDSENSQNQSHQNNQQQSSSQQDQNSQQEPNNENEQQSKDSNKQNDAGNEEGNKENQQQSAQPTEDKEEQIQQGQSIDPKDMTEEQRKAFEQTLTQWLRKVPDEPSRLLREKMRYEYQKRQQKRQKTTNTKKIW